MLYQLRITGTSLFQVSPLYFKLLSVDAREIMKQSSLVQEKCFIQYQVSSYLAVLPAIYPINFYVMYIYLVQLHIALVIVLYKNTLGVYKYSEIKLEEPINVCCSCTCD